MVNSEKFVNRKKKTFAGTLRASLLGPSEGTTPRGVLGQHIVSTHMIICYKTVRNTNIFLSDLNGSYKT